MKTQLDKIISHIVCDGLMSFPVMFFVFSLDFSFKCTWNPQLECVVPKPDNDSNLTLLRDKYKMIGRV